MLDGYPGKNSSLEQAWDFIQGTVSLSPTAFGFNLMARNNKVKQMVQLLRVSNRKNRNPG